MIITGRSPRAVMLTFLLSAALARCAWCADLRGVARAAQADYAQGVVCVPRDSFSRSAAPVRVPAARINDDYCDCLDGADEPGTAACGAGQFWCNNDAFRGAKIPRAWVDDGACDCCDGSDEPPGTCPDRCAGEREAHSAEARAAADAILKGVAIREGLVAKAGRAKRKDERELAELKVELERIIPKLAESERVVERLRKLRSSADGGEQLAPPLMAGEVLEPEPTYDGGASSANSKTASDFEDEVTDEPEDFEDDARNAASGGYVQGQTTGTAGTELLHSTTEGPLSVEDRASGDGTLAADGHASDPHPPSGEEPPASKADQARDVSDGALVGDRDGTNETDDINEVALCASLASKSSYSLLLREFLVTSGHRWFPGVMRRLRIDPSSISANGGGAASSCFEKAEAARGDLQSKKSEMESRISALEARIGRDYGHMDDVLRTTEGKCMKKAFTQYEFELCHFDKVQQYEGGSVIARLGEWGQWQGAGADRFMSYENGDQCWNGPRRSTKVRIICGAEDDITAVEEPNRCSYEMTIKSPAACRQEEADAILAGIADAPKDEL